MRSRFARNTYTIILLLLVTFVWISNRNNGQCSANRAEQLVRLLRDQHAARVECRPGKPCQYPEEVDFRIIAITFNRPQSIQQLLLSLDSIEMDGDTVSLEIWIDRHKTTGEVDCATLEMLSTFKWPRGQFRVHVHQKHVGIYGQWIDTWRPKANSKELAVILEDDMSVSPYIYRWIKAVHMKYGSRTNIAGYTLQSEKVSTANGTALPLDWPERDMAYLFKRVGSWGYAPRPQAWIHFQDWFHQAILNKDFHPYVVKAPIVTQWYKEHEAQGIYDEMWTIWHSYHSELDTLFTVYNNIEIASSETNVALAVNREETGLHFSFPFYKRWWRYLTSVPVPVKILNHWSEQYVILPDNPVQFDWDGTKL